MSGLKTCRNPGMAIRGSNPGPIFSIPGFGIEKMRRDSRWLSGPLNTNFWLYQCIFYMYITTLLIEKCRLLALLVVFAVFCCLLPSSFFLSLFYISVGSFVYCVAMDQVSEL